MPYTVAASFDKFRQNIELSGDHRETASARKNHIVSLLKDHFEILEAFPTGSIPKFTAVKEHADLDVIVVLHYGKHIQNKKPSQVLQEVRDILGDYRANVRKNGQAVTLYYKTWPNVDIVPVSCTFDGNGRVDYYSVPDMNREEWIQSRPQRHAQTMTDRNALCGDPFKLIIKMVKWWNHQHSSLLQSFHIEVLALNIFTGALNDYPWDVFRFFDAAANLANSSLWYDGAVVDNYLDWQTRPDAVQRLQTARDKARDAWYKTYQANSDHEGAITIWREIFGDQFPAYGA